MTEIKAEITLEAAEMLTFSEGETAASSEAEGRRSERTARLLEAGDYPDKGLHLTGEDLDGIVARFSGAGSETFPVPVKVEHVDSPLDPLGHVKRVWRDGGALFGTLSFPDDLAAFLRRRGAAKLSVGLTRVPLALREVSLVLKPRVAGAVLMGGPNPGESNPGGPSPGTSTEQLDPTGPSLSGKGEEGKGAGKTEEGEIGRLRAELRRRDEQILMREVDAQVAAFKAQGRIVPASEAPARALLAAEGEASVTLSEGPESIGRVFKRFLEAQPPAVTFGEAMAAAGEGASVFTQYEHTFLSKKLGVDPDRVAALIRAEQARTKTGQWASGKTGEKTSEKTGEKGEDHAY